ncbi:MAG: dihydroneopterin aldolase [Bacteroidaceae bacterium]|nr:dihydroneopterin aldolase [Bacteroidaceae bacterium]
MTQHAILINGLRLYAYHGVLPQERKVGANFTLDLRLETDFTRALETDQLDGTVSYAEVCDVVRREMAVPSQLLEHVGGRIVKALHRQFPEVKAIKLRIIKDNPPMGADLQGAGIEIEENY